MRSLLLLLLCCCCCLAGAGPDDRSTGSIPLPVRAFTADEGLGGATITALVPDRRGFLWVGTPDELLLYDGQHFMPFRYTDTGGTERSFRRVIILEAEEDHWLMLHEDGAHAYTQADGRLRQLHLPFRFSEISSRISIVPETGGWYRLSDMTLTARYHPASGKCRILARHLHPHWPLRRLTPHGPELLDCDTSLDGRGFRAARTGTGEVQGEYRHPFRAMSGVAVPEGLLLLDGSVPQGLWQLRPGREPLRLASMRVRAAELRAFPIGDLYYLSAGSNLLRFRPATGEVAEILDEQGRPPVGSGFINQILRTGRSLWVGTNAVGLLHVTLDGPRFRLVRSTVAAHNFTHALLPYRGKIYVGTYTGEVLVYDSSGSFLEHLTPVLRHTGGVPSAYINAIEPLPDGSLFIVSGLNPWIFDPATRSVVNMVCSMDAEKRAAGIDPKKYMGRMGVVRAGSWEWWISDKAGLIRWQVHPGIAGQAARLELKQLIRLPPPAPEAIGYYAGAWYCATAGKLYELDVQGIRRQYDLPVPALATCLQQDAQGRLWIATESGIIIWRRGSTERILSTNSGLPNNHIYALRPDAGGRMWGSSNGGLFAVRTRDLLVRAFTNGDGLQGAEFNLGAAAVDPAGRLYFGGMNGVNIVDPDIALREEARHPVTITRIAGRDTVFYSYPGAAAVTRLQLPHDRAQLHIVFTSPQTVASGPQQYEYRLKEADSIWTDNGSRRELQLYLAPGDYNVEIRLRGRPGTRAAIHVTVDPPFYRSALFLALLILAGGAAVAAILIAASRRRYRQRLAALETARRIQAEKERISRELHDELGARAAMLAHNASLLQGAAAEDPDALRPIAARMEGVTADMLTALRETVWTLKQEAMTVEQLWIRYKNFVAKLDASYEHIRFVIDEEGALPEWPLDYGHALNLLRILQEATMNAVKHSGATVITVCVQASAAHIRFSVADNGKGFDADAAREAAEGNGLHNMLQRSKEAGLRLSIQPRQPQGTEVEVLFPRKAGEAPIHLEYAPGI